MLEHALRPLFSYLRRGRRAATAVFAATADCGSANAAKLRARITQAATELVAALHHEAPTHADPYDNPTPFEDLLNS